MPTRETIGLSLVLAGFAVAVALGIAANNAFGYDESVYALLARHWVSGTPTSGWGLHRPVLLSVIGIIPASLGGSEWAFRIIGAGFGAAVILATRSMARSFGGAAAGLIAAAGVAASPEFQVQSGSFLTDVPATFALLLLAAVLWRHLSSSEPIGATFLWLAPIGAAAFYLRYGAILAIASLAVAAFVTSAPRLIAARGVVSATGGLFVALLVPHLLVATTQFGSPWGIIVVAQRAAAGSSSQSSLLDYVAAFPLLVGPLGGALALLGIAAVVVPLLTWRRSSAPMSANRSRYLGLSVLIQIAFLGTIIHAEGRYILFPMTLLVIAGSSWVASWLRSSMNVWAMAAVAGVALLIGGGLSVAQVAVRTTYWDWKRDVGLYVRAHAFGPCSVLTSDVPIMAWYSGCPAYPFAGPPEGSHLGLLSGQWRYVIVREDGDHQPAPEIIARDYLPNLRLVRDYFDGTGRLAARLYRAD